jgi:tetratricopeptide (TPR) repeat protein
MCREYVSLAMPVIVACGFFFCGQPCAAQLAAGIRAVATEPNQANSSNIVTIHELSHVVPKKAKKEMEKAERARAEARLDEVVDHLNKAILIDPEYVAARNNLAVVYFRLEKPDLAIRQLEEAVKVDPHNATVLANLSVGFLKTSNWAAAERAARRTLDLDRTSASRARVLLGLALIQQHRYTDEALDCFSRAREEFPVARLLVAAVLIAQRKPERARLELETYLSSRQKEHRTLANRWLSMIDRGLTAQ